MPRQLSDLRIDEVSLVYKGANQHAKVTIAKSADEGDQEDQVEIFDQEGNPIDVETLEDGDIVFNAEGVALQYDENADEEELEVEAADERELESVGKGWGASTGKALGTAAGAVSRAGQRTAKFAKKNRVATGVLGATAIGGGVAAGRLSKSAETPSNFASDIRVKLSKAMTDEARDEVMSEAFGYVEHLETIAKAATATADAEREIRLNAEYLEIAKSYSLPVSDEDLARVMKNCAESLSEEDCQVISKCFATASEAIYDEVGQVGGGANSNVLAEVEAYANQYVSKGFDSLDATNAVFEQNPDLYDQYLAGN